MIELNNWNIIFVGVEPNIAGARLRNGIVLEYRKVVMLLNVMIIRINFD